MDQRQQDLEHLRLLAIFHYVLAGIMAVFACFPVFHLVMGIAMVGGRIDFPDQNPPPPMIGWFFIVFASGIIGAGWIMALLVAVSGRFLQKHRNRTFCLVVAGLQCLVTPLGTVLGVFTIVVLMRESVAELFEEVRTTTTSTEITRP